MDRFNQVLDFLIEHPLYLPFVIFNAWLIYKLIQWVINMDESDEDDEDEGGIFNPEPGPDLNPQNGQPVEPEELVLR